MVPASGARHRRAGAGLGSGGKGPVRMRSLVLLGVYVAYLALGGSAPFVFGLGYIWTDLFTPQNVAYIILNQIPVSLIMALCAIGFYALADRRDPPRPTPSLGLLVVWIMWVSLTTTWADFPDAAWYKWNWAVKSIIFATVMPFLFRSRVQIEAAILTILLSISGNLISFGAKTIISGGGYGRQWTLGAAASSNTGLNESSTIALVSAAVIPLVLFLKRHSLIVPKSWCATIACVGITIFAVMTCLGSFARAGLVSLLVLGGLIWVRSRRKLVMLVCLGAIGAALFTVMPESWSERMDTMFKPHADSSAATRLEVWKWTLGYAADHPLGGGFDAYRSNAFTLHLPDGTDVVEHGRAYHSMYFEILGEQGYVGFAIFTAMIGLFFWTMMRLARRAKAHPELEWLRDLAHALMTFAAVYLCGGAFVGIAFQPLLYYVLALGICSGQCYRRCMDAPAAASRQAARPPVRAGTLAAPQMVGTALPWRQRRPI